MRRHLAIFGTATAIVALAGIGPAVAQEAPGEGTTVSLARATWDTGWFQAAVYQRALEELGYEVDGPTTLDNPPFYQAVAQGDVHLWVNGWFPLHNTYEDTFSDGAEKVGVVAEGGALQGYLVDKATAEEMDITNIEDFKRDEVKEAFDADGDGKADMVACPPGWGCELVIEHHMDAYELRDHINLIKASYSASMADAIGRYNDGEPILFYTWTPNWTVGILRPGEDVVWIETPFPSLPEDQADLEDETTVSGVEGCVADPCAMGWPANDIVPVANSEFLDENPAVRALLETASIPIGDIFAQNARMQDGEDSEEAILGHADEWIAENQDLFDSWLEEARSAAM